MGFFVMLSIVHGFVFFFKVDSGMCLSILENCWLLVLLLMFSGFVDELFCHFGVVVAGVLQFACQFV